RILTAHISDRLFVTEPSGHANLLREGANEARIHFVGNTMIDSLETHLPAALEREPWQAFGLRPGGYSLTTLHRPANVDNTDTLRGILSALEETGRKWPVLFPAHPRTSQRIARGGIVLQNIRIIEPLGYLDFLGLMAQAKLVLTDSGGIQEETTALGVPCITIRENTERPVTVEQGTNRLAGTSKEGILAAVARVRTVSPDGRRPDLWDGQAAPRVVAVIEGWITRG
ncbi:MAG: UDP-N-acetyl glucosamine 2-epimerase, partial [Anaerolineales bacterium]